MPKSITPEEFVSWLEGYIDCYKFLNLGDEFAVPINKIENKLKLLKTWIEEERKMFE